MIGFECSATCRFQDISKMVHAVTDTDDFKNQVGPLDWVHFNLNLIVVLITNPGHCCWGEAGGG